MTCSMWKEVAIEFGVALPIADLSGDGAAARGRS